MGWPCDCSTDGLAIADSYLTKECSNVQSSGCDRRDDSFRRTSHEGDDSLISFGGRLRFATSEMPTEGKRAREVSSADATSPAKPTSIDASVEFPTCGNALTVGTANRVQLVRLAPKE